MIDKVLKTLYRATINLYKSVLKTHQTPKKQQSTGELTPSNIHYTKRSVVEKRGYHSRESARKAANYLNTHKNWRRLTPVHCKQCDKYHLQ